MPDNIDQYIGTKKTYRLTIDQLQGGWSTRSFPHAIKDTQLAVLDNFVHLRDNIWTVRPGNSNYGGGSGATGSSVASLAGTRFYSGASTITGQLCVQSGGNLYTGVDVGGAFTSRGSGMSTTQAATFAQMYDPDNLSGANTTLFICDGSRTPRRWDGTNFAAVQQGGVFLPSGVQSGVPITPLYVGDWNYSLCYANEPTDQCAFWISDQLRPERFTATAITDTAGSTYIPYYPGGKNSALGVITGFRQFGPYMIVFFTNGVVTGINTGSYGAFQYIWQTISRTTGCTAPRSIVAMDFGVIFFGGDRFYATDGNAIYALPDEIPTVYANDNITAQPPEIANPTTVCAARNSLTYLASYETTAGAGQTRIVAFDTQANGGWQMSAGTGGAWSRFPTGMPMAWGIEGRGPGDAATFPFFWGSSQGDVIAQYDAPGAANTDFGTGIAFDIRSKNFYLERPANPKTLEGIYPIVVIVTSGSYSFNLQPYAIFDPGTQYNFTPLSYTAAPAGPLYGTLLYGTFLYAASAVYELFNMKSYPNQSPSAPVGQSFALGLNGTTTKTFNIIGWEVDLLIDEPEF